MGIWWDDKSKIPTKIRWYSHGSPIMSLCEILFSVFFLAPLMAAGIFMRELAEMRGDTWHWNNETQRFELKSEGNGS